MKDYPETAEDAPSKLECSILGIAAVCCLVGFTAVCMRIVGLI